jgi:hypothetical protein
MNFARQRVSQNSKDNAHFVQRIDDLQRDDAHARTAWAAERKALQATIAKSAEQLENFRDSDEFARAEREFKNRVVVLKKENKAAKEAIHQLEEDRDSASAHSLKLEQRVLQMVNERRTLNEQVKASSQKERASNQTSHDLNNRRYKTLVLTGMMARCILSSIHQCFACLSQHAACIQNVVSTAENSSQTCGAQGHSKHSTADRVASERQASEKATLVALQDELKKQKAVSVADKCSLREAIDASQKATRDYRRMYHEFKEIKRKESKQLRVHHSSVLINAAQLGLTRFAAHILRRLCTIKE